MTIKNFLIKTFLCKHFPKEKNGLPPQKGGEGTEESSFIEGETSGRGLTAKDMATIEVKKDFPNRDKSNVEVRYKVIKRGGREIGAIIKVKMRDKETWYPLYTHTKTRGNRKKLSTKDFQKKSKRLSTLFKGFSLKIMKSGKRFKKSKSLTKPSKRTEGLQITKMNNPPYVNALAKDLEKIPKEDHSLYRRKEQLVQEREQFVKKLPLRERLKELFKKTASPWQPLWLLLA